MLPEQQISVIREEFDEEFGCITVDELRWLLRRCRRHSAYYTYFLLRAALGIRGGELLKCTLHNLSPDLRRLAYKVDKPKTFQNRSYAKGLLRKHRTVFLEGEFEWIRRELQIYCDLHFGKVKDGDGVMRYVSVFHDAEQNDEGQVLTNKLFPWKNIDVVVAYWHKLRKGLVRAGFRADRLESLTRTANGEVRSHVLRPHILRHFAATIRFYRCGKDLAAVRKWIHHSKMETTAGYVHEARELGLTEEEILRSSWPELLGFAAAEQRTVDECYAPEQTSLSMF